MLMEKLMSKRGQISMEIGILVAAAVAVAAVAAFFYINSVQQSARDVGQTASRAVTTMQQGASDYITSISQILKKD